MGGGPTNFSLAVPSGGPGGGTGYGTAQSSNDGRPEPENYQSDGFGGASTSSSPSRSRPLVRETPNNASTSFTPPPRPVSPGCTTASAFKGAGSTRRGVLPTPQAVSPHRPIGMTAGGLFNNPTTQRPTQDRVQSLAQGSPSSATNLDRLDPSDTQQSMEGLIPGFDPNAFQADQQQQHRSALSGLAADQKATSYGFLGGHSSPGKEQAQQTPTSSPVRQQQKASTSPSAAITSRIRGLFATRPSSGSMDGSEPEDEDDEEGQGTPYGVSSNLMSSPRRPTNRGKPVDPLDAEAEELRRETQRAAVRLIDEERRQLMMTHDSPKQLEAVNIPTLPNELARGIQDEGWTSEALEGMTDAGRMQLVRRLTDKSSVRSRRVGAVRATGVSLVQAESIPEEIAATATDAHQEVDWVNLTPAQKIIAETRSRHLQQDQERAEARVGLAASSSSTSAKLHGKELRVVNESDERMARGTSEEPPAEVPVRRTTRDRNSPRKRPPLEDMASQSPRRDQPTSAAPQSNVPAPTGAKVGLAPGNGPLPSSHPDLVTALDEMMTRFYRYERYSVPLMRALEGRVGDIERDAIMAQQRGAAQNDRSSVRTASSGRTAAEMDRWVGQMTAMMKHEIGQLMAATKELREGREMLLEYINRRAEQEAADRSRPLQEGLPRSGLNEPDTVRELQQRREEEPLVASPIQPASPVQTLQAPINLAAPVEPAEARARSTSPSGRPRFTNALSRPYAVERGNSQASSIEQQRQQRAAAQQEKRASVLIPASAAASIHEASSAVDEVLGDYSIEAEADSTVDQSLDSGASELVSPPLQDQASTIVGSSMTERSEKTTTQMGRRQMSLNDRLKGLMSSPTQSDVASSTDAASAAEQHPPREQSVASSATVRPTVQATPLDLDQNKLKAANAGGLFNVPLTKGVPSRSPGTSPVNASIPLLGARTSASHARLVQTGRSPGSNSLNTSPNSLGRGSSWIPETKAGEVVFRGGGTNGGRNFPSAAASNANRNTGSQLQSRAQSYLASVSANSSPATITSPVFKENQRVSPAFSSPGKTWNRSPLMQDSSLAPGGASIRSAGSVKQGNGMLTMKERRAFFESGNVNRA